MTDWRAEADPTIARIERLARERDDLEALVEVLDLAGEGLPDLAKLAGAGPLMSVALLRLPPQGALGGAVKDALTLRWERQDAAFVVVVGPPAEVSDVVAEAPSLKGRSIPVPEGLPAAAALARAVVADRRAACVGEIDALEAELQSLSDKHAIAEAIGDFGLFEWLQHHAGDLSGGSRLVYVTGWTSLASEAALPRGARAARRSLARSPAA